MQNRSAQLELEKILRTFPETIRKRLAECSPILGVEVERGIVVLHNAGLLTEERRENNFDRLMQLHGLYIGHIVFTLNLLNITGLLTGEQGQANFEALIQQAPYAEKIKLGLHFLINMGANINQAYFTFLIHHAQNANDIATALVCMRDARLLTVANLRLLNQHATHARGIATALGYLHFYSNETDNRRRQNNFECLIEHIEYINDIARALNILYSGERYTSSHRTAQTDFNLLIQQAPRAKAIADMLYLLNETGLLSVARGRANFLTLMQYSSAHHILLREFTRLTYAGGIVNADEHANTIRDNQLTFDKIIRYVTIEYNTQRFVTLASLCRANLNSPLKISANQSSSSHPSTTNITPMIDMITELTGMTSTLNYVKPKSP